MKQIDGIKFVQVDGLTRPHAANGASAPGGNGSLAEQAVAAAPAYRAQSPIIDGLHKEIGISGSSWQPVHDFEPLFGLELGGCPSLVLPSCLLEEHEAIAIHARWLAGFRGMRDTWRFIKKYPSDPWTRVNESVNFGFERYTIPAIRGEDISELYWKDELARSPSP
jgi:Flotillin